MAVNFNLLRQAGPANFYEGFTQGQEEQRVNALNQQKMAQEQDMNALRRQQAEMQMRQTELEMQKTRGAIQDQESARRNQVVTQKTGMFRDRLLRAPTPEAAREVVKMQYADPDVGGLLSQFGSLDQALAEVPDDLTQFQQYVQREAMGMSEWMKSQLPKTVGNRVFDPRTMSYIEPPERPQVVAPSAPVAVIGPDGKPQYVSREQAIGMTPFTPASVKFIGGSAGGGTPRAGGEMPKAPAGYRYTPTGDLEPIPGGPAAAGLNPKDIQKREATFPQATASVKSFETKSEQFIKELEKLRDDPGLNQITGPIYGRTPSVSREGSRAQSLYDKIFAKGGFQALQDMREASKTGGALGNVSNEEGRRLEKSIVGGLDRTQNIKDVQQGINDLIEEIRVSQARVREAYDSTYAYKAGSAPAAAAPKLAPQDQEALNWANSNPNDPRSAQIKQRLGVR
jgi:hypothetical protein